jgi:hypothetical protein
VALQARRRKQAAQGRALDRSARWAEDAARAGEIVVVRRRHEHGGIRCEWDGAHRWVSWYFVDHAFYLHALRARRVPHDRALRQPAPPLGYRLPAIEGADAANG